TGRTQPWRNPARRIVANPSQKNLSLVGRCDSSGVNDPQFPADVASGRYRLVRLGSQTADLSPNACLSVDCNSKFAALGFLPLIFQATAPGLLSFWELNSFAKLHLDV